MKFVAAHGDEAAAVTSKQSMKLLSLGDDAGRALLRHKEVVVPMLETYGSTAARALATVTPKNGRRLVMLAKTFDRMQQTKKVVEVVAKHGDRVVDWMWAHKGGLATTAALAAFLADPEGFMSGARKLTDTVAKQVVVPVVNGGVKIADSLLQHAVKPAVTELSRAVARSIPWGTLIAAGLVSFVSLVAVAMWRLLSLRRASAVRGRLVQPAAA